MKNNKDRIDVRISSEQTQKDERWRRENRPLPQRGENGVFPKKTTLTDYMCKTLLKFSNRKITADSIFYETLKPSDIEYIEFLYNFKYLYGPTIKTGAWGTFTFEESNIQNVAHNTAFASDNSSQFTEFRLINEYCSFNNAVQKDFSIQNTRYYKRLETLNNLNYFNINEINIKIRKVAADKLRNMILRAMYNPRTELGKIMFQKRLEIDGLDSIHLV